MKLFQRLLVAPAALGLLSPIAVNANELNLNDISNYSNSNKKFEKINSNSFGNNSTVNPSVADVNILDTSSNTFEAGGFSETTTASFSADFAIGAVDGLGISTGVTDGNEQLTAEYGFQIDLNTSFTGEDSLDIAIDAGNADGNAPLDEFDLNGTTDALTVDGISYTFPLWNATVMVGDNIDGSELFTTACAYSGPTDTLDDCGNVNAAITNGGTMLGVSYDFGSGFTGAFGYAGSETNIATNEGLDAYGLNVAYTADSYGVSVTYAAVETHDYIEDTFTAFNAYWSPEGLPSISAGFETGEDGSMADGKDGTTAWFVGLESEVGPGTLGGAIGTQGSYGATDEELMYEAYYSYPVNDGMTVTPVVYIKEQATSGTPDQTGVMVKTSFSF
jgi:hypothetical protein